MEFTELQGQFSKATPQSQTDQAAQLIVSRVKDPAELKTTYRAAPDLFDDMTPQFNSIFFKLLK